MRTPILLIAAISLAANSSLGVLAALIDGGARSLQGLRDGFTIGLGAAPVLIVTLIERRPMLTTPAIVGAAWTLAALVTLGPTGPLAAGKLVICMSIAMGCVVASLIVRRDREINPLLACPTCGYDLFGITSGKCPECGGHWSATHMPKRIEDHFPWNLGDLASMTVGITASAILWSGCLFCAGHI